MTKSTACVRGKDGYQQRRNAIITPYISAPVGYQQRQKYVSSSDNKEKEKIMKQNIIFISFWLAPKEFKVISDDYD